MIELIAIVVIVVALSGFAFWVGAAFRMASLNDKEEDERRDRDGPHGKLLAERLGEQVIEAIDGFPAMNVGEVAAIAEDVAGQLIAYAAIKRAQA